MSEHTSEPWEVSYDEGIEDAPHILRGEQHERHGETYLEYVGQVKRCEDARRIVLCVNACEGLSNQILEEKIEKDQEDPSYNRRWDAGMKAIQNIPTEALEDGIIEEMRRRLSRLLKDSECVCMPGQNCPVCQARDTLDRLDGGDGE